MKNRITEYRNWKLSGWLTTAFILIILFLFIFVSTVKSQTISQVEIDKFTQSYVKDKRNKALVVGIIHNGQQQIFTLGETLKGNGIKPDSNSIFELGAVSEVFTTSIMAILETKGKISSLEPVGDILKGVVKVPYYQRIVCETPPQNPTVPDELNKHRYICFPDPFDVPQMMVLCDLATHSAGFLEEPGVNIFNTKNPYASYNLEKLNKYIASLPPNQSFGYQYNHSMIGTALLAEALTHKTGKDYNTLLKDEILTPLSMNHTFITPNSEQSKLFLTGHTAKGNVTIHRNYNVFTPAAGIRSNATDLLRFMQANLSNKNNNLDIALSETHIPKLYTDPADSRFMVGWGWIVMPAGEKDKRKIVWQCSEKGGFSTFIGFVKESQTAVVILSNTANAVDDMGMNILKYLISPDKRSADIYSDKSLLARRQAILKKKAK